MTGDLFAGFERPAQPAVVRRGDVALVEGKFLVATCFVCGAPNASFGSGPWKPEAGQFGRWTCFAHRNDLGRTR